MKNIKLKGALFFILLFLLIGVVSASEDTFNDTVSIPEDTNSMEAVPEDISEPVTIENNNPIEASSQDEIVLNDEKEDFDVTVSPVTGTQGKTVTLKATVKSQDVAIKSALVTFKFNGNIYKKYTDENGVASVTVKCPTTALYKIVTRTSSSLIAKIYYYQKNYNCDVSVSGEGFNNATASFNMVSKRPNIVKQWRIIKQNKLINLPVKNGLKTYYRGSYEFAVYKIKYNGFYHVMTFAGRKNGGLIKFTLKHHFKEKGTWKWSKWAICPAGNYYDFYYTPNVKCDKVQVRYTQVGYKQIR